MKAQAAEVKCVFCYTQSLLRNGGKTLGLTFSPCGPLDGGRGPAMAGRLIQMRQIGILIDLIVFPRVAVSCQSRCDDRDKVGAERVIKMLQTAARNHLLMTADVPHHVQVPPETLPAPNCVIMWRFK